MNDIAISITNLGKYYGIYSKPRDRLKQFILPRLMRLIGMESRDYFREFWAVRNVSFEVRRGETVGIIGRNGSGKSTLLQMICGTLTPTSGSVETHGRVAALLELGSGFNPDFTGRENVYLNGSVLGISREEMDSKIADILAFADIGDFIDQPVKTYSSGMFVRLAFSVIAHIEPDILVIDEALAVGDAFFQSKCAAAMRNMMSRGTTILFVSHDTHAVKALCDKAILMDSGSVVAMGETGVVIEKYYSELVATIPAKSPTSIDHDDEPPQAVSMDDAEFNSRAGFQRIDRGRAKFSNVILLDSKGQQTNVVEFGDSATLRMVVSIDSSLPVLGFAYHIRDMKGFELVYSDTGIERDRHLRDVRPGSRYIIDWTFKVSLMAGEYNFSAMASIPLDLTIGSVDVCDFIPFALQFRVTRGEHLPIYAAMHWDNALAISKI